MKYTLTALGLIVYGLLVHYGVYIPVRFNPQEYYGILMIIMGVIGLIVTPFSKRRDIANKENKKSYKDIILEDKCAIVKSIGIVILFLFLFEYVDDFIFIFSLITMLLCESVMEYLSQKSKIWKYLRIFIAFVFLLAIMRLFISAISRDVDIPIFIILFLLYSVYALLFKHSYRVVNLIVYSIGLFFSIKFAYKYQLINNFTVDAHMVHYVLIIMSFLLLILKTINESFDGTR